MTHGSEKRVWIRAGLLALLLALPGQAAFAFAIAESTLTVSNLTIVPASGSLSFEGPLGTMVTTHAFNSLGGGGFRRQ